MSRSDRMAALKAARKAKMQARRARMAAKKAKKTRPKTAADKAFKETFKKSGGMAAMAARRNTRAAAKPKVAAKPKTLGGEKKQGGIPFKVMDTTDQNTIDDLREGRTSGSDYYKKGGRVKKNMGGKIRGYGLARGGKVVKSS
tara:strand:- start:931 stop:1359 length:429 start_codon:yes stop_codon:yes gene_type:complete